MTECEKFKHNYKRQRRGRLRKKSPVYLFLLSVFILSACSNNQGKVDNLETQKSVENYIYYVDKNETKIVGQPYIPKGTTTEELIEEYLEALNVEPEDISLKKSKPEGIIIDDSLINEDNTLSIYFNSEYSNMTAITEVLCRASYVKTLCQIEGIEYVEFYVGGQILKGINDKPLSMRADDFINDTSAEAVYVTVYFANKKGTALVESHLEIRNAGNIAVEKLILDRLIEGPVIENQDSMLKTLPADTQLIKVTTKDGICYVDFNDKFLSATEGIKPEIVIYSVVNSLVELSSINKVQFTIDGTVKKIYREDIPLDGFFERNLELVEGSK